MGTRQAGVCVSFKKCVGTVKIEQNEGEREERGERAGGRERRKESGCNGMGRRESEKRGWDGGKEGERKG